MKMKIAVIGLGYVGLPLAHAFSSQYKVVGFDIAQNRIDELVNGYDKTLELSDGQMKEALNNGITFTKELKDIDDCNIYIVTTPTPIDKYKKPDLSPLLEASKTIGGVLKKDDIVIYESTVYPGATEEECVPILEEFSNLKFNKDFFCGYSPERINPGDKRHTVTKILKVTSGSTLEIAKKIDALYASVITAGTYLAPTIKVAEAAKVIENTQRDVNIALINELSLIFDKLDIDTEAVLEAAGTKWNFLPFRPGLVGGHCIGVDPYYLTHKAIEVGCKPEMILAGRRLNDNMGFHIVDKVSKLMTRRNIHIVGSNILIMGLTFKENCPDLRNTRIVDLIKGFENFNCNVDVYDPWVDKKESMHEYGISTIENIVNGKYDAIVLAVAHDKFKKFTAKKIRGFGKENCILYDVKYMLRDYEVDGRL
jgi:UDP-N-acetyl-D-glucosamine/UDP-N-acetyl-D-galactosamine dehydrogenase